MSKHHLIAAIAGIAIGYFGAATLSQYEPFKTAYIKGASFGAPKAG